MVPHMRIVNFDDVKAIFESHSIWSDGHEIYWYQRAWECLKKGNLAAYSNYYERVIVYIRAFTLIMIYGEFCELALDEMYSYEFFRDDVEDVLSDFTIGQLIMKFQYEFSKLPHHSCEIKFYNNDDIDSVFFDLISEERHRVFNAIEDNISISRLLAKELIFAAMYITAVIPFKNVEEEIPEEINSYEDYLSVCERYYDNISELIDEYDEVYSWLLEGTYKI